MTRPEKCQAVEKNKQHEFCSASCKKKAAVAILRKILPRVNFAILHLFRHTALHLQKPSSIPCSFLRGDFWHFGWLAGLLRGLPVAFDLDRPPSPHPLGRFLCPGHRAEQEACAHTRGRVLWYGHSYDKMPQRRPSTAGAIRATGCFSPGQSAGAEGWYVLSCSCLVLVLMVSRAV